MQIKDNFEIRQKKARGEFSEIYKYDEIPEKLRNQIWHIMGEIFEQIDVLYDVDNFITIIVNNIRKELGRAELIELDKNIFPMSSKMKYKKELIYFLLSEENVETFITGMEIFCNITKIHSISIKNRGKHYESNLINNSIEEINFRFKQNQIGYQYIYEGEVFVPINNEFLHSNVIRPLFTLLDALEFESTLSYFASAFEKYKERDFSHTLVDANNSFESTLKKIIKDCDLKCDNLKSTPKMLGTVLKSELVDQSLKKHIYALQSLFESISDPRHEKAAHGNETIIDIPESLVECVLNSTASCILYLVKSYQEYMRKQEISDK